jgi:hypothetical protein
MDDQPNSSLALTGKVGTRTTAEEMSAASKHKNQFWGKLELENPGEILENPEIPA